MAAGGQKHGILLFVTIPMMPVASLIASIRGGGQLDGSAHRLTVALQQEGAVVPRGVEHPQGVMAGALEVHGVADPLARFRPTQVKAAEILGHAVERAIVPIVLRVGEVDVFIFPELIEFTAPAIELATPMIAAVLLMVSDPFAAALVVELTFQAAGD